MLTLLGNEHVNKTPGLMLCVLTRVGRPTLIRRLCSEFARLSPPPPWLEQTTEKCVAGKPTEHSGKQELDRCWSGTGLESPFSCPASPSWTKTKDKRQKTKDKRQKTKDKRQKKKKKKGKNRGKGAKKGNQPTSLTDARVHPTKPHPQGSSLTCMSC